MRSTGLVSTGATFIEALAAEEGLGILEGDFWSWMTFFAHF